MEVVASTASVLQIIAVGLTTTKSVYQTVTTVRDGPDQVQHLSSAINDLVRVLEQIKTRLVPTQTSQGVDFSELQRLLQNYVQDVEMISKKVERLTAIPNEGGTRRVWKGFKIALKKDELEGMWRRVSHHIHVLGLQLNTLRSETDMTRLEGVERINQSITTYFTQDKQSHSEAFNRIDGNIQDLQEYTKSSQADMRQSLCSIESKMTESPGMSVQQFNTIKTMIEQLQNQVAGLPQKMSEDITPPANTIPIDIAEAQETDSDCPANASYESEEAEDNISANLARLCQLAEEKDKTATSEEAQSIIEDLEGLLDVPRNQSKVCCALGKRKQQATNDFDECDCGESSHRERDIKRARALITASSQITVNQEVQSRPRFPSNTRYMYERRQHRYKTRNGTLSMMTRARRVRKGTCCEDESRCEHEQGLIEFLAAMQFMPADSRIRAKITLSARQRFTVDGFSSLMPTLSIHAIVPEDSEIFECIKRGDLNGLIRLLDSGKASLRDCTPGGQSLLGYACSIHTLGSKEPGGGRQLEICRFLIQKGAEIDSVETAFAGAIRVTILGKVVAICDPSLPEGMECMKLLLQEGADPMIECSNTHFPSTALLHALYCEMFSVVPLMSNLGHEFIDLYDRNQRGRTQFLQAASHEVDRRGLAWLLDQGSDISAKDNDGNTCLHLLLHSQSCSGCEDSTLRDSLIFVISSGADVTARNNEGYTPADIAYKDLGECDGYYGSYFGSYFADLWDAVLTFCGYNVAAFRGDQPRKAKYTDHYTPCHYRALWRKEEYDFIDGFNSDGLCRGHCTCKTEEDVPRGTHLSPYPEYESEDDSEDGLDHNAEEKPGEEKDDDSYSSDGTQSEDVDAESDPPDQDSDAYAETPADEAFGEVCTTFADTMSAGMSVLGCTPNPDHGKPAWSVDDSLDETNIWSSRIFWTDASASEGPSLFRELMDDRVIDLEEDQMEMNPWQ